MSLAIRRATVEDAATLSSLATATFVETFGHLYEREDLQAFLDDAYAVEKQATILAHPDYAVWFLEADGRPVGHCAAGPCGLPHDDVRPGDGEIKRLYVLREFQGGQGGRLMDTAMAWLERDGPRTLWVGVVETRLPGVADHIVLPSSHTGLVFSAPVARQVAAFLREGRFER